MTITMQYVPGKIIIDDKDDCGELLGLKATIDLIGINKENDFEEEKIGECIIYIFNDEEESLFYSADTHSQRLSDMIGFVKTGLSGYIKKIS